MSKGTSIIIPAERIHRSILLIRRNRWSKLVTTFRRLNYDLLCHIHLLVDVKRQANYAGPSEK